MTGTAAGLHLVVHPSTGGLDDTELAALAQGAGVDARPLSSYTIAAPRYRGLVIGYGHQHPDAIARGVGRLADQLDVVSRTSSEPRSTSAPSCNP